MAYCFRHEDRDALYECSYCGKPICGDCMRFVEDDDGDVICPACTSEAILEGTSDDFDRDLIDSATIRERLSKVNKLKITDLLNPIWPVILLLLVGAYYGVNYYLNKSQIPITMTSEAVQNAGNPILELSMYMVAVFQYAEDHSGRFPDKLEKLFPDYVDKPDSNILASGIKYSFVADGNAGFVLSCAIADRFDFAKMFVTKEGLINIE